MVIYEIGTGYTPIPARMGAATEIVAEELARALQAMNAKVKIIDIKAKNRTATQLPIREVWVPECFAGTDVKLGLMHKLKRVVYSVSLAAALRCILQEVKEEVILHFHNQYNLFFFLKLVSPKLRAKARICYTVHSYIWQESWAKIEETVRKRYFQEVCCVRHADVVLVLNDQTASHLTKHLGVPGGRIHKVRNGVNMQSYRPLPPDAVENFRRERNLTGNKIIFQAGSVCDRKNQLGAVEMLTAYLQKHPDVIYVYAGGVIDEAYQQTLAGYAAQHGITEQVRYAGELPPGETLNLYYNAADVTAFPSKLESFGLVIVESLSAGTPVLLPGEPLFDLHGGWRVYRSGGEFEELADACIRGCCENAQSCRAAAQPYSWEQIAREHLEIWGKEPEDV